MASQTKEQQTALHLVSAMSDRQDVGAISQTTASPFENTEHRAAEILKQDVLRHNTFVDKLLIKLLVLEWIAEILVAVFITPQTWIGNTPSLHMHIWMACGLGFLVTLLPFILATTQPGKTATRYSIAVAQGITSAILIHLTGGRIETHFHIFGSLAVMAFYRDWKVLVLGTVVVAIDHALRGLFWPQSVFGTSVGVDWRWVEHAAWVVFEDFFLIMGCLQSMREMRSMAKRQAHQESISDYLHSEVRQSATRVLSDSQHLTQTANNLGESTDNVSTLSARVSDLTEQLSQNMQSVTNAIGNTAQRITTVSKLSSAMESDNAAASMALNMICDSSNDVAEIADSTTQVVKEVAESINSMSHAISNVSQYASQSADKASHIEQSIKQSEVALKDLQSAALEINKVVDLIKSIASQTNLLALNATIEAASAGEAGKGFAVVANEVKTLATQSADSTKSIQQQVYHIQSRIENIVQMITGVTSGVSDIIQASSGIASAVEEQSQGVRLINANIQQAVDYTKSMAQKAHDSVEQSTETAQLVQKSVNAFGEIAGHLSDIDTNAHHIQQSTQSALSQTQDVTHHLDSANQAITQTQGSVNQVQHMANQLTKLSQGLTHTMERLDI